MVVNGLPSAWNNFLLADACVTTFAQFCLDREVRFDHDGPGVLLSHREIVISVYYLHLVWKGVRANFLLIEEVEVDGVRCYME